MGEQSNHTVDEQRRRANRFVEQGNLTAAEACFAGVLNVASDDLQAMQFLASRHLSRGETERGFDLLHKANAAHPNDGATLHQLGIAYMAQEAYAEAAEVLRRGLVLSPGMFVARLRLGVSLEHLGQTQEALKTYFGALTCAQEQGRWLSDATTAPVLRQAVQHAMRVVETGRHGLFHDLLEPLRARHGKEALRRVEKALAIYLEEEPPNYPDPRQRPRFLYLPDVPSTTFYPRERFPWCEALESAFDDIRAELAWAMRQADKIEPFLSADTPEQMDLMLRSSREQAPSWDGYFFFRHGERYQAQCDGCPKTAAVLDALPLVRIPGHAPEVLFSVLTPGSHILPHQGVTNTRLVTHLPLIIPEDCAIRVGGELHAWKEGRCVTFDDTFAHEAWNRSARTRVVLILDCWNPDMTEVECEAVTELVVGIGAFNDAAGVAMPKDG